jgi:hypothetical protein
VLTQLISVHIVGSVPAVMEDRRNCLRIEVQNAADCAEKIRFLVNSPEVQFRIAWTDHYCITELMNKWQRAHLVAGISSGDRDQGIAAHCSAYTNVIRP